MLKILLLRFQEGARIVGDKAEFKGLSLRKSTTAKSTGAHFEESVERNILRPDEINRSALLKDIITLEDNIRNSLNTGELRYASPANLGLISGYKEAYSMPVVRGMTAWNAVCPENPIREGSRVHLFRSHIGTNLDAISQIIESCEEGSEEYRIFTNLRELFFDATSDENLVKSGFNWIAIPFGETVMPNWVRKVVDHESVLQANTSPIFPLLESVGLRVIRTQPETYTNVIRF